VAIEAAGVNLDHRRRCGFPIAETFDEAEMEYGIVKGLFVKRMRAVWNRIEDDFRRKRNIGRDREFESGDDLGGTPFEFEALVTKNGIPGPEFVNARHTEDYTELQARS
jgi:hypothetical protein